MKIKRVHHAQVLVSACGSVGSRRAAVRGCPQAEGRKMAAGPRRPEGPAVGRGGKRPGLVRIRLTREPRRSFISPRLRAGVVRKPEVGLDQGASPRAAARWRFRLRIESVA